MTGPRLLENKVKLPKRGRLVRVAWDDAASNSGWDADPKEPALAKCQTVGYLRHKSRRRIVLAASRSAEGNWADRTTIPRSTVRTVHLLHVAKAKR